MKQSKPLILEKPGFNIVMTLFTLWFSFFIDSLLENFIAYFLILTFGIIHGANDLSLIDAVNKRNSNTPIPFYSKLRNYLLLVLAALLFFFFFPVPALVIFILISAYHFGEEHFSPKRTNLIFFSKHGLFLNYGLLIFFLLFSCNLEETNTIIYEITKMTINPLYFYLGLFISSMVILLYFCFFIYGKKMTMYEGAKQVFFLLIFSILFKTSSLVWSFTVYFVFWHSIPSLLKQVTYLYGSTSTPNLFRFFRASLWYWLAALVGLTLLFFYLKDSTLLLVILFAALASITLPHVWVLNKMMSSNQDYSKQN